MTTVGSAHGQISQEDTIILHKAIREVKPHGQIVYVDSVSMSSDVVERFASIFKDNEVRDIQEDIATRLTKEEQEYLLSQLNLLVAWPDSLFTGSLRLEADSTWTYLKQMNASRFETINQANALNDTLLIRELQTDYPYVFVLARPIYIRNNTVCLVFYFAFCGHTCGQSEASFYKKENDEWTKWILFSASDF